MCQETQRVSFIEVPVRCCEPSIQLHLSGSSSFNRAESNVLMMTLTLCLNIILSTSRRLKGEEGWSKDKCRRQQSIG